MKTLPHFINFGFLCSVAFCLVSCSTPKQLREKNNTAGIVIESVDLEKRPSVIMDEELLLPSIAESEIQDPPLATANTPNLAEMKPSLPEIPQSTVDPLLLDVEKEEIVPLNQVPKTEENFAISSERIDSDAWKAILNARETSGLKAAESVLSNLETQNP